ncbi:Zn(2)-C6 fungal-type domain-containing protein [Favolaschia claudopus]|uniref:Zn(2)-C6 fungal-type domain-containing protein n=1 Tax=Favolaschia claudopus TaxID=2862362 RepID=A0AAW0CKE5_9AGAR
MVMATDKMDRRPPLKRGKACLNCSGGPRDVDGVHPICGPCIRIPKDDTCEFNDSQSRTQELESLVFRLQSRLDELQGGSDPLIYSSRSQYWGRTSPSARSSPFSEPSSNDISPTLSAFASTSQSSPASHPSSLPPHGEYSDKPEKEPPRAMIIALLQYFLPHATQFGFFLHPIRFKESVLLPFHLGDDRRPSPALIYAAYLWGAHLSQSPHILPSAPYFLKRAQRHITANEICISNPTHLLHTIQAQVLLSTYLLRNNQFLEAEFHLNGAATLALGCQLHKIRSSRPASPPLLGVPLLLGEEVYPAPPVDGIEEGERIRAFWTVVCLQIHLMFAAGAAISSSAAFCLLESPGMGIDTPWPFEIEEYEGGGGLRPEYRGQETIRRFLTSVEDPTSSQTNQPIPSLHAKASVLLYRAMRLSASWSPALNAQALSAYQISYTWLDRRITAFWQSLPPLVYAFYADRTLALTHALTACAAIRLHDSPGACDREARRKCVFAARGVLDVLGDVYARVGHGAGAEMHPVGGALCGVACGVLMGEVRRARMRKGAEAEWAGLTKEEINLVAEVRAGLVTMGVYAVGCPLVGLLVLLREFIGDRSSESNDIQLTLTT